MFWNSTFPENPITVKRIILITLLYFYVTILRIFSWFNKLLVDQISFLEKVYSSKKIWNFFIGTKLFNAQIVLLDYSCFRHTNVFIARLIFREHDDDDLVFKMENIKMEKLNSSKSVFCYISCQKIIPKPPQVSTTKVLHVTLLQFTIRRRYMQSLN